VEGQKEAKKLADEKNVVDYGREQIPILRWRMLRRSKEEGRRNDEQREAKAPGV